MSGSPGQKASNSSTATVAIIGLGAVGSAALQALAREGVALHLAEVPGAEGVSEGAAPPRSVGVEPHWIRGPSWWSPWLASCGLCLLCADVVDPTVALEVNARCIETGVPLLPGLIMGEVAQLGPVIAPGRSPCLRCLDLRLRAVSGSTCLANFGPGDVNLSRSVGQALAERAVRFLANDDGSMGRHLTYLWADGAARDHPVLRTWHCEQCAPLAVRPPLGNPTPFPDDDPSEPDPAHILRVAARLVDPVTGPIRVLQPGALDPDEPPIRHWMAALADPGWAAWGQPTVVCGGNSLDDASAQAAALGEAVERMAVCQQLCAEPVVAPYREVRNEAVDPASWDVFDPATRSLPDFPFAEVSEDEPISWVWGWSVARRQAVLVPALRVFAPLRPRTPADWSDHPPMGGAATATTMTDAVLRAAMEVLERDGFMIAWANRLAPPRLDVNGWLPDGIGQYASAFAARRVDVRCSLLVLDHGVPVVIAMARGTRAGEPAITVAAGAGLDAREACRHALAELSANRLHVKAAMAAAGRLPRLQNDEIRDQTAHALLYARPEMAAYLDFWWDPPSTVNFPPPRPPSSTRDRLDLLMDHLAAANLELIVIDITPPEIRDLGLAVARVLIPGTYPMNFDSRWPHLGGLRMRTAPVVAGLVGEPKPFEALNRIPHPFP